MEIENQLSFSASFASLLIDFIDSKKISRDIVFNQINFDIELLKDPVARIPFSQILRICNFLEIYLNNKGLGLELGQSVRIGHFGAHGIAMMSCSTISELLTQHINFSALTTNSISTFFEIKDNEYIQYTEYKIDAFIYNKTLMEQLNLSTIITMLRWFTNKADLNPKWISFQHAPPENIEEYNSLFKCKILFSQENTAISFDQSYINLSLPHQNPTLLRIMQDHCKRLLKELDVYSTPSLIAKAQQAIIESFIYGPPKLEEIASKISLSEIEFHSLLKLNKISYRYLVDDLRKNIALGYIRDPQLTLIEITYLLGFSEQSSFQRAFKRWTNQTPRDYRFDTLKI